MSEEQTKRLQNKYAEIYVMLREEIGNSDPRSFDNAVARMEESLMWAIKGVHNGGNKGSDQSSSG